MKKISLFLNFLFVVIFPQFLFGATLTVPGNYPTIKEAIDAALSGDTVLVSDGVYIEESISILKPVTVKSVNGPAVTVVEADSWWVGSDFVTIEGIYFKNSICIGKSYVAIKNNIISTENTGISLQGGDNITIIGNYISNNSWGLAIYRSNNSSILKNTISHCGTGIMISSNMDDEHIDIIGNTISFSSAYGIRFFDYYGMYSNFTISENAFTTNNVATNRLPLLLTDNYFDSNADPVPENIAIDKPVIMSSYNFGTTGSEAVDGVTEGDFTERQVTCTHPDPTTFWQVDLMNLYTIERIKIYNRTDCCQERLSNFYVEVSNNGTDWQEAIFREGPAGDILQLQLNGLQGRFLRIRLAQPNYLSLAEVEIFGKIVD